MSTLEWYPMEKEAEITRRRQEELAVSGYRVREVSAWDESFGIDWGVPRAPVEERRGHGGLGDELTGKILAALESGSTYRTIIRELGVSVSSVTRVAHMRKERNQPNG